MSRIAGRVRGKNRPRGGEVKLTTHRRVRVAFDLSGGGCAATVRLMVTSRHRRELLPKITMWEPISSPERTIPRIASVIERSRPVKPR